MVCGSRMWISGGTRHRDGKSGAAAFSGKEFRAVGSVAELMRGCCCFEDSQGPPGWGFRERERVAATGFLAGTTTGGAV